MESQAPAPAASPGSFLQIWILALTRPREDTYQAFAEDSALSISRAAIWIFLSSLVAGGIGMTLQFGQLGPMMRELGREGDVAALAGLGMASLLCLVPLFAGFTLAGQAIYIAILQFVAGALGGVGSFEGLFTATAAYIAPVTLVSGVLGAIPLVGACLSLPVSLYAAYLGILTVKSVNRFSWGRAILTFVIPLIVFFLCGLILFLGLLLPVMQESVRDLAWLGSAIA